LNWTLNATSVGIYKIDVNFTSDFDSSDVPDNDTVDAIVKIVSGIDNPPTYSNNATNTTVAGQPANFTLDWEDDNGLSGYIFSINNNDTWQNASFVSFSGTSNTSQNVTTLNSTVGVLVQWKFYTNDSANQWNTSLTYNLTTTSEEAPEDNILICSYFIDFGVIKYCLDENIWTRLNCYIFREISERIALCFVPDLKILVIP